MSTQSSRPRDYGPSPSEPPPSYDFEPYLRSLSSDWCSDDDLLQRLLDRYAPGADHDRVARLGPVAAGPLRELAEESARPENAPRLRHYDAHGRRTDEIVLPGSTLTALGIAHREAGLGAVRGDAFVHYSMIYLVAQNGEAGVACSLGCTDGLVRALEALGDGDLHRAAVRQVMGGAGDRYAHGAQFVTEIQGGSDVPANRVRAVAEGDRSRLYGQKWFCSNINADWFLVTARPEGAPEGGEGIALFLVPAFLDMLPGGGGAQAGQDENRAGIGGAQDAGQDENRRGVGQRSSDAAVHARLRNGYTIDRLKDKMGTRELATAEVTFDGAIAWPVGPLDRGLPNLLRYVLTPSRVACVISAAAGLRQAERIVAAYTGFREAFGQPIARYPLVSRAVARIQAGRATALACVFELVRLWVAAERSGYRGEEAVVFRLLLSLAKPALTRRCTELLHEAIVLLAGNGIEERFSPLPSLFRDSLVMETWEGPHNVLFTQALRDMHRFELEPRDFVEGVTGRRGVESDARLVERLSAALAAYGGGDPGEGAVLMADLASSLVEAVGESVLEGLPSLGAGDS